jgi:hypothetical protein
MKRFIPFWTFMSRNVPLQFTQMWTRPKMYLRFQSLARNFSVEPPEFFPEYIQEQGGFDTGIRTPDLPGMAPGMPLAAAFDLPHLRLQEDIRRTADALSGENPGQIFSDVNPFFTAMPEYALATDFYTGRRYDSDDYSQAQALGVPIAALLSTVGGARRGADGKWYLSDKAMNTLQSLIPPLERGSRLTPEVLRSEPKNADRLAESWARFFGAPVRTISEDQMRAEQTSRYYDRLNQMKQLAATGG